MKKEELREIKKGEVGTGLLIENDGYMSLSATDGNKAIMEAARGMDSWHVPYPFIVDAVFQKYDIKNANGRVYPERVLKKQVKLYQQKIDEHMAYGECNHPSDSTINLSRVSHNIIELHWDGRTLVGKMEINTSEGFRRNGIVTTCGDEVANLLLNGYKIGVSSRGVGSVEEKLGQTVVGDDFELICWDVVSDPSTPNAYISAHGEEELATYIESDESKSDKSPIREMVGKINKILD